MSSEKEEIWTLLTGATLVHKDWYKPLPPKKGIDWRHVSELDILTVYELCSLSVGISPQTYTVRNPVNELYTPSINEYQEFDRRVTVAKNNVQSGKLPTIKGKKPKRKKLSGEIMVKVSDFVAFADTMNWRLPPEFPRPKVEEENTESVKKQEYLIPENITGRGGKVPSPASILAKRRHAESYAMKEYALAYWRKNIDPSLSASKAADKLLNVVPLSHKVLAELVSAEKKKQS
ncbi:MAG: hypothetical protein LBT71_00595 [Azoarcus sp.]|jgi:hypothetical protein|nr:hypothetical protein [Azoarcus sp.]